LKTTLWVLIASFALALPADALDLQVIASKPGAHNPQFDSKAVWPGLVGDEYFLKEKWPKARLLIWAHAGKNPTRSIPLSPRDAANWIDAATGKPADTLPDMDTDIILPDADQPYKATIAKGEKRFSCRHMTVGRNAEFRPAGGGILSVYGNVWLRPDSKLYVYRTLAMVGARDTFIRRDWPRDGNLKKRHDTRTATPFNLAIETSRKPQAANPWSYGTICHFMVHDKPGKTTEIVGYVNISDELGVKSGTFIVGRDSRFLSVGPAAVTVNRGAKVVLMDGSQCSHGQNQLVNRDWNVASGGQVTGGTPDRPLKRDAYFGLGYRNWMNLPVPPRPKNPKKIETLPSGAKIHYGYGGYNAQIKGDLIGYPAKGTDARLVVCWQRIASGGAGAWGRSDEAFKKMFPTIPPKIGIWVSGDSRLDNVRFDDLHRGGLVTQSMETFKKWKSISFGGDCLSKDANDLVRGYEAEIRTRVKGNPTSILEPIKKYTTMPE